MKNDYTFETFRYKESNFDALALMARLVEEEDFLSSKGRCIWLVGPSGSGKTHLLYSVLHGLEEKESDKRGRLISCDELVREYIRLLHFDCAKNPEETYIRRYCMEEIVLIEDVDYRLSGLVSTQEAILNLVTHMVNHHGKVVVLTSHHLLEPLFYDLENRVDDFRRVGIE